MQKNIQPKRREIRRSVVVADRRQMLAAVLVVIVGLVFGFPDQLRSAVYVPPTGAPPTGDVGLPINITGSTQTKAGALTFSSGLDITSPTGNPNLDVFGRINWNADVKSDWPSGSVAGNQYVAITPQTPPDQPGWAYIRGPDASVSPYTLKVRSALPTTTTPTYAAWGVSDPFGVFPGVNSYGVYALAGANNQTNFALSGNAPTSTGWAGYFAGNVTVLAPYDVMVGDGILTEGTSGVSGELCINDSCRSAWPTAFDTYWSDTGTVLELSDASRNLAVGGNDATAQFYAEKISGTGEVILTSNGVGYSNTLKVCSSPFPACPTLP